MKDQLSLSPGKTGQAHRTECQIAMKVMETTRGRVRGTSDGSLYTRFVATSVVFPPVKIGHVYH